MKKRLWWSMWLSSALLLVTAVTAFADRPGVGTPSPGGKAPSTVTQVPPRVPSSTTVGTTTIYKAWEGLNSTSYLNQVQRTDTQNFADIAAGPADILTVVNYQIVRYPNPNTVVDPGTVSLLTSSQAYNNIIRNQTVGGTASSYLEPRRATLDRWLGPNVLGPLCPTLPRTSQSCLIGDAVVRYDQLQGRFLVLMTVIDTGLTNVGGQLLITQPRKASWVLAVSTNAVFNLGSANHPSDMFVSPTPGSGTVLGGLATANWFFYFGTTVDTLGADGFGCSNQSPAASSVNTGNINCIPGVPTSNDLNNITWNNPNLPAPVTPGFLFNCAAPAPTDGSVCYFPTAARLGIDNDSIIISSPVVNTNTPGNVDWQFAGNRVRILRKVPVYNGATRLSAGNQYNGRCDSSAGSRFTCVIGDYYDVYANRPNTIDGNWPAIGPIPQSNGLAAPTSDLPIPNVPNNWYNFLNAAGAAVTTQAPYTLAPPYSQVPFELLTPSVLADAVAGTAYTQYIAAGFGTPTGNTGAQTQDAYTYAFTVTPALPASLTISTVTLAAYQNVPAHKVLRITGTPVAGDAANYVINVTATDANGATANGRYTLAIFATAPAGGLLPNRGFAPVGIFDANNLLISGNAFQNIDYPAMCEPQWLRGRPAASFSNALIGTYSNTPAGSSQSYLECIKTTLRGAGVTTNSILVQPIQFIAAPQNPQSNTRPGVSYYPMLISAPVLATGLVQGGTAVGTVPLSPSFTGQGLTYQSPAQFAATIPATGSVVLPTLTFATVFTNNGWSSTMQFAQTEAFSDPANVGQAGSIAGDNPSPQGLYVGDDRPQKVVFREGHLYDARGMNVANDAFPLSSSGLQWSSPAQIPGAVEGSAYSYTFAVTGGTPGFSCRLFLGTIPGLKFTTNPTTGQPTCVLAGTPPKDATHTNVNGITYNFSVQIADALGANISAQFSIVIVPATVAAKSCSGGACTPPNVAGTGTPLTTIAYDILQKIVPNPIPPACQQAPGAPCSPVGFPSQSINRVFNAQWYNASVYGAMFDVPANVTLAGTASSSPINFQPWIEKLFVATTYPALQPTDPRLTDANWGQGSANCVGPYPGVDSSVASTTGPFSWSGLFDIHCGQDTYDLLSYVRNPVTGQIESRTSLTTRNGGAIDPNNGGLWNYGMYATPRDQTIPGPGQWGSYAAFYDLSFPQTDPYGNGAFNYTDVPYAPKDQLYIATQVMKNVGVIAPPSGGANSTGKVVPSNVGGATGDANTVPTRMELAKLVATSLSDETGITAFLQATGGCYNSFADVPAGCGGGNTIGTVTNTSGVMTGASGGGWRYSEFLYRKGVTLGTGGGGVDRTFSPADPMTRATISAFVIRAKMNNVFPTSLSGCPVLTAGSSCTPGAGDNFPLFVPAAQYFDDVPNSGGSNLWFPFVQKMFELRITNGETVPVFNTDGSLKTMGHYGITDPLTRGQVMVMLARAFFY